MNERIIELKHEDINWSFDGYDKPTVYLDLKGSWKRPEIVDPFPCYPHNRELVEKMVEHCESKINLKFKPQYFILPYECPSRTNGYACENEDYQGKNADGSKPEKVLNPYIVLHGKRICIHPAMTRYLVAHELGHVVDYNLQAILGKDNEEFDKEYAEMRGISSNKKYGALNWHKNTGEIIANDIRIILFGVELEFWQHEEEFPTKSQKVIDFWANIKKQYLS